jgi:hypothetical protein
VSPDTKAVWYSISNSTDDDCFIASTESNFDTVLAVYEGEGCDELTCVTENDDFGGLVLSKAFWAGGAGRTYYVLVGGLGAGSGELTLTVEKTSCVASAQCEQASKIESLPFVDAGATIFASVDGDGGPNATCPGHFQGDPTKVSEDGSNNPTWAHVSQTMILF